MTFAAAPILCMSYIIFPTCRHDICDLEAGNLMMCPQCKQFCPFWPLYDSCILSRLTYLVDNGMTVAFACLMSFWATTFLEFWKRRQAVLSWEWDLR